MRVAFKYAGPAVFIRLTGPLGAGADVAGLHAALGAMVRPGVGVRAIFLDCSAVELLDGTGIGELIRLRRAALAADCMFGLVNVEARQRRLIEMARLTQVLGVYDTIDRALADLPAGSAGPAGALPGDPWRFHPLRGACAGLDSTLTLS